MASGEDPVRQLIRSGPVLIEVQLYPKHLGDEMFEAVLKTATALEIKRKEQHDPSLIDIGLCILAKSFSRDFLARIPSSLTRIQIYEWQPIQSHQDEAVFIHEVKGALESSTGKPTVEASQAQTDVLRNHQFPQTHLNDHQELSTPELIAFAKLGMELRSQKNPLRSES